MSTQSGEILETVKIAVDQHFDIRTITVGIDLHDCTSTDIGVLNQNTCNKITTVGKDLAATVKHLSVKYDMSIVNQRISVTPIVQITVATKADPYISVAQTLDKVAKAAGVSFIGDFSASVQGGTSLSDEALIRPILGTMKTTDIMCSSINIDSTHAGVSMDTVRLIDETTRYTAETMPEGFGCTRTIIFCNAVENNPFMAGAFHGSGEADAVVNVGVPGPGVVKAALGNSNVVSLTEIAEVVKKAAFKITRVDKLTGHEASKTLGIPFGILDLLLVPTPAVGNSVACILGEMDLSVYGTYDTTAASALLNDAVRKGGMMASSVIDGLSGVFIPVSKDRGVITAVEADVLTLGKPGAMAAVCSVGLDMIAVPDDTPVHAISSIIVDEATIDMINSRIAAMCVILVMGKIAGDSVEFSSLLSYMSMIPVKEGSCEVFVNHGDRIPVPA